MHQLTALTATPAPTVCPGGGVPSVKSALVKGAHATTEDSVKLIAAALSDTRAPARWATVVPGVEYLPAINTIVTGEPAPFSQMELLPAPTVPMDGRVQTVKLRSARLISVVRTVSAITRPPLPSATALMDGEESCVTN